MRMTKKGIVRKIRRTVKRTHLSEITTGSFDKDSFIGDWPNSGENFVVWIDSDIGYVHVGLE